MEARRMNALEQNIAVARGEALAAHVLASLAIRLVVSMARDRNGLLAQLSAEVDDILNHGRPGTGDPDDEPSTLMRETARNIAMQHLDGIRRGLPGSVVGDG
jgi:hypothetical protein